MPRRDAFSGYHPAVNLAYFAAVIALAMLLRHPLYLVLSLACALRYRALLGGRMGLRFLLPLSILTALVNPLFSHEGMTVLTYLPGGNPLTLESIAYGLYAGAMLAATLVWFSCCNAVLTDEKIVYLFGRVAPSLSLLLTMSLRFVPRFFAQGRRIAAAQRALSGPPVGLRARVQRAMAQFSALLTWALERAVDTADSMNCRGYGLPGRTSFSVFRFSPRDGAALTFVALCVGVIAVAGARGALSFRFYPTFSCAAPGLSGACALAAFLALQILPVFLARKEARRWKRLQSAT